MSLLFFKISRSNDKLEGCFSCIEQNNMLYNPFVRNKNKNEYIKVLNFIYILIQLKIKSDSWRWSCWKDFCSKKVHVKCWWNWHLLSQFFSHLCQHSYNLWRLLRKGRPFHKIGNLFSLFIENSNTMWHFL